MGPKICDFRPFRATFSVKKFGPLLSDNGLLARLVPGGGGVPSSPLLGLHRRRRLRNKGVDVASVPAYKDPPP